MLMRTTLVVMLVALGMLLEHVRAQGNGPLADAQFNHLGFVVRDVDESIKAWNAALQADHTPVHEVANLPWPASSPYNRKTVVRTTEIPLPGAEFHLLQPIGGANNWREHLEKYGEGCLEHVSFRTKDVKGTADALVKMGGTLILGENDSMAYIQMPQLPFKIELNRMN